MRYIKLGPGGAWAKRSLEHGEIHFGHREVAHEVAATRDRAAIMSVLTASERRNPMKAADFAREVMNFYTLGPTRSGSRSTAGTSGGRGPSPR